MTVNGPPVQIKTVFKKIPITKRFELNQIKIQIKTLWKLIKNKKMKTN